jgi:hypothetical protein
MKALLCYSGISLLCLHPAAFAAASFALPRSSGSGGVASASASSGDGAVAVLSASSRSSLSSWLASSHDKSDRRRRPSPLHYRAIDELDEESDPRMIKVKSRAPKTDWFGIPGGVKNLLASAAAGPQRDAGAESNTAAVAPVDKDLAPASIQPPRKRTAMNVKLIRVLLLNQVGSFSRESVSKASHVTHSHLFSPSNGSCSFCFWGREPPCQSSQRPPPSAILGGSNMSSKTWTRC